MTIKIPKYEDITVLVVGDVMLDRYWRGATSRISPEAPVPVVHVKELEDRPGGAANVALNLQSLGAQVILLGIVGDDIFGNILEKSLQEKGIICHFQRESAVPTITKLRVLGRNQQLIRLDFEEDLTHTPKDLLLEQFKINLPNCDAVIFSDYGKGIISTAQQMIQLANEQQKRVFVDPKNKDFSFYSNATIITPNLKEFEEVVGHCESEADIVAKGKLLLSRYNLTALLVTRGEEGMSLLFPDQDAVHLKANASEVFDVSGAGDTVISVLAASVTAGLDFETACMFANAAAGVVVRKLGVATISVPELRRALQRIHDSGLGILNEDDLSIAVTDARAHGEKIVMTNGCFDMLHVGHITYLEEARRLGDRLVVAINDDSSVKKLKGDQRPINNLADRMAVLSALRCVDWVVAFTEETPERIISKILPDILVKGGDYQIPEIAGSTQVLANGGEVKILSFVEGYSTSATIKKIEDAESCMS